MTREQIILRLKEIARAYDEVDCQSTDEYYLELCVHLGDLNELICEAETSTDSPI